MFCNQECCRRQQFGRPWCVVECWQVFQAVCLNVDSLPSCATTFLIVLESLTQDARRSGRHTKKWWHTPTSQTGSEEVKGITGGAECLTSTALCNNLYLEAIQRGVQVNGKICNAVMVGYGSNLKVSCNAGNALKPCLYSTFHDCICLAFEIKVLACSEVSPSICVFFLWKGFFVDGIILQCNQLLPFAHLLCAD